MIVVVFVCHFLACDRMVFKTDDCQGYEMKVQATLAQGGLYHAGDHLVTWCQKE